MDSSRYTFQTFAVLATGVYLRRNDAFLSGCIYLLAGAVGTSIRRGRKCIDLGILIASGGYLLAFPLASALVAEGLDRSRNAGVADFKAQLICWACAMIPVYLIGTLWLAEAYSVEFSQAYEWGVKPFLLGCYQNNSDGTYHNKSLVIFSTKRKLISSNWTNSNDNDCNFNQ